MPLDTDLIQRFLENNLPSYLADLRRMVEINSFTWNAPGVNLLGKLTAERFATLGFQAERQPSVNPEFGQHLALQRAGEERRRIALISHLDTVFPPEEEIENDFRWRESGDQIYGPGTIDIKGGTMMIFMILQALSTFAPGLFEQISWSVLLNSSEETISEDFADFCRRHLHGDVLACLVFEGAMYRPDEFFLITRRKGMAVFRITANGRGAHAGSSHPQGANAILQIADIVRQVSNLTDYERDLTINVGNIRGGTVSNRVPHHAEIEVEMRVYDQDTYQEVMQQIIGLQNAATVRSRDGYACQIEVEILRQTPPWTENERSEHLFSIWQQAAGKLGGQVHREDRGGLSDANLLWMDFPTIDALGPSGGNAHCSERSPDGSKDQEYLFVPSLIPKTMLNLLAIYELAGGE